MTPHWFQVTTLAPVLVTASSATVGQTPTLHYLPGAMLRGAVASRLYDELLTASPREAVRVFHRGAVRFGDAVRCRSTDSEVIPVPLSLHHPKGDEDIKAWRNHVVERIDLSSQPTQVRSGYLDARLDTVLEARFESSERTAIGPDDRAREGFLYGLQAIQAGQEFLARIDIAADLDAGIRDVVLRAITGRHRLGRSRSAEFGLVSIDAIPHPPTPLPLAERPASGGVPILVRSDWALHDPDSGSPSALLVPAHVGLPRGAFRVDPARTFVRTRRYSPFNGKRGRPDHERWVIMKGSVVTVRLGEGIPLTSLRAAFSSGVGAYRSEGLGEALVAPALLCTQRPAAWGDVEGAERDGTIARLELSADPMFRWARTRSARLQTVAPLQTAQEWAAKLRQQYPGGVSRSQWGRVRGVAMSTSSAAELKVRLSKALTEGGRKNRLQEAWGARGGPQDLTLADALLALIQEHDDMAPRSLAILAGLMLRPVPTKHGEAR